MATPPSTTGFGVIWTTTSVHGNTIYLYEEDWEHATDGHPELVGLESVVRRAVEKPRVVKESGRFPDSCAFEIGLSTNPEGLRVFVQHDTELFLQGGTQGHFTTGYPISKSRYQSRVGGVIQTYPENEGDF